MTLLVGLYTLAVIFLSGNAKRVAAIVAFMLFGHALIDSHLTQSGSLISYAVAATFNALNLWLLTKLCDLDSIVDDAVKIITSIMVINITCGLAEHYGNDIFNIYSQLATALYALLIINIGVSSHARTDSVSELGSLPHSVGNASVEKVS